MIKHTPGPWFVDGPPYNQIVWSSNENRVCFLAHSGGLDEERDLATGLLIAAAPDLLDALKGLIRFRNWELAEGGVTPADLVNVWKAAEAAIAKAEGGAA